MTTKKASLKMSLDKNIGIVLNFNKQAGKRLFLCQN